MPASTSLLLAPPFPETGGEHSYTHSQQVSYNAPSLLSCRPASASPNVLPHRAAWIGTALAHSTQSPRG
jgi:hypothetical protein